MQGHIQLRDISFNYPARPELQIFKGFSLDVPAGKTVALVGESGSGKCVACSACMLLPDTCMPILLAFLCPLMECARAIL